MSKKIVVIGFSLVYFLAASFAFAISHSSNHTKYYQGMVAGDFDADTVDEVAFDFGASGTWIYDPNYSPYWFRISFENPEAMIAGALGFSAGEQLIIDFGSQGTWKWSYDYYNPGIWEKINTDDPAWMYCADVEGGDSTEEVVIGYPSGASPGIYVYEYDGVDFSWHKLWDNEAPPGFPAAFLVGGLNDELIHDFGANGVSYWTYFAGWPAASWTKINPNDMQDQSLALDLNGYYSSEEELLADFGPLGVWLYVSVFNNWYRQNYGDLCEAWPVAFDQLDASYEVFCEFCGAWSGLWMFNPGDYYLQKWQRVCWNNPDFILGANISTGPEGNNGEEAVGDFGALGIWIQLKYLGTWTRVNWNNPERMIKANIDGDGAMEIIFDFGDLGVWTWDFSTGIWDRINWGNPEDH